MGGPAWFWLRERLWESASGAEPSPAPLGLRVRLSSAWESEAQERWAWAAVGTEPRTGGLGGTEWCQRLWGHLLSSLLPQEAPQWGPAPLTFLQTV